MIGVRSTTTRLSGKGCVYRLQGEIPHLGEEGVEDSDTYFVEVELNYIYF